MLNQKLKYVRKHLGTAVRDFRNVASIFPSSSYSARAVLKQLPTSIRFVVEYGGGTGNITRETLKRLAEDATLATIELNPRFVEILKTIGDPRLRVIQGDVLSVLFAEKAFFGSRVDAVISGIPFSMIPPPARHRIVEETRKILRPGGCFIAYQNSKLLVPIFEKCFDSVTTTFEPRNFLPYFIIVGHVRG